MPRNPLPHPPPWVTDLRPVERRAVLVAAAVLIAARFGAGWAEPRFWAEEATIYFSYAWTQSWLHSLLLVPTAASPAGYMNLAANLPATLAAKLLPLDLAPRLTTLCAFLVQLTPIALVLVGRSSFWRHRAQRVAAAALLVVAPCLTGDVWLNTINSQIFLGLSALLLLLEDFPPAGPRSADGAPVDGEGRARRWAAFGLVGLGALSGPYTALLAPLFLVRGFLGRSGTGGPGDGDGGRTHRRLGWIALAGAIFQGAVFAWTHQVVDLAGERLVERPIGWRLANLVHFQLLRPLVGTDGAHAVSAWLGLDALVRSEGGVGLPSHYLTLAGWSSALLLGLAVLWLVRGASPAARWLAAAWLLVAPVVVVLIGPQRPTSRYMAVPGLILLLLILARAFDARRRTRRIVCGLLVVLALGAGLGDFFDEEPAGSLGLADGAPRWTAELAAWRDDPERVLDVWPYVAPFRWRLFLAHAETPAVRPVSLDRPLRLVSRGEVTTFELPVDDLESDFRLDLRLIPSCRPDDCLFRMRLEDGDGGLLGLLAPPPRWQPGRPLRWAFDRSDPRLDGIDLPRVERLVLVVRSLDRSPVRWIVQTFHIDRRVRGVLEPLLPPIPTGARATRAAPSTWVSSVTWVLWASFILGALLALGLVVLRRARTPEQARRPLRTLAILAGAAPVLAWFPRVLDGQLSAVLYREPKLVAGGFAAWVLVAALAVGLRGRDLRTTLERTPILILGLWLGWAASTRWWGLTPSLWLYEMVQHLGFAALAVTLLAAARRRPEVLRWPLLGVVCATAVATLLGGLQAAGLAASGFAASGSPGAEAGWPGTRWLAPIDAWVGVAHPSTMGYKNPMALVVLAQLFVLGALTATATSRRRRGLLAALLLAELAYLGSLQSRTALLALAVGALAGAGALAARRLTRRTVPQSLRDPSRPEPSTATRRLGAWAVLLALAAGAVAAGLALSPGARDRAEGAVDLATSPAAYLATDRGVYLRNTLQMVRHHPLGVGLGDWQTAYPVFRRVEPSLAFDDVFRVRRAHSDHVQALGETGWPGLAAWLALLGIGVALPLRRWWRDGRLWDLALGAQMVAVVTAMATDYVTEMPALELIVAFLWIAAIHRADEDRADEDRADADRATSPVTRPDTRTALLARTLAVLLALAIGLAHLSLLPPRLLAADARALLDAATLEIGDRRIVDRETALRVVAIGRRLERWPGLSKTLHRDARVLSVAAHAAGEETDALRWARWSLRLHRHDPEAFRLLATLTGDPGGRYERAAEHILQTSGDGFRLAHPLDRPELPRVR